MTADNSAAGLTAQLEEEWDALEELGAGLDDTDWAPPHSLPGLAGRRPVRPHHRHRVDAAGPASTPTSTAGRAAARAQRHRRLQRDVGRGPGRRCPGRKCWPSWPKCCRPGSRRLRPWARTSFRRRRTPRSGQPTTGGSCRSGCSTAGCTNRTFVTPSPVPAMRTARWSSSRVDEIVRALGFIVGKKAAAPEGSSVTFELTGPVVRTVHVAVDGRAAVVDRLPGAATATVALGSRLFTRLACGRVDPAQKLAEVHFAGDTDLGRRVVDQPAVHDLGTGPPGAGLR